MFEFIIARERATYVAPHASARSNEKRAIQVKLKATRTKSSNPLVYTLGTLGTLNPLDMTGHDWT